VIGKHGIDFCDLSEDFVLEGLQISETSRALAFGKRGIVGQGNTRDKAQAASRIQRVQGVGLNDGVELEDECLRFHTFDVGGLSKRLNVTRVQSFHCSLGLEDTLEGSDRENKNCEFGSRPSDNH